MTALLGLAARLRLARLCLCTDSRGRQGDLAEFLAAAYAGGVDIVVIQGHPVQIRQPDLAPEAELAALETARRVAPPYDGLVGVHGSPVLAARSRTDILHLEPTGGPADQARRSLSTYALVGRSTRLPVQVDQAVADPAVDYLWVPAEPDLVRYAAAVAPVQEVTAKPWFAGGRITAATLDPVLAAGARRIVVGRAITEADDPQSVAGVLSARLAEAWRADPALAGYALRAAAFG